jgi:neutral amino acid transport system permease protein
MEAGSYAAGEERTLSERLQELIARARALPAPVKSALGLLPLFLVVAWAETPSFPDEALKVVALVVLFAAGVAALTAARGRPALLAGIVIAELVAVLVVYHDLQLVADTALTGLSTGSIFALGAVGLTLVYGILKLVNFAHGDFLTFGAYIAFLVNVTWELPFALAILAAMVMTAVLGVVLEKGMWAPMRARGAGMLQLLLMSIGLALVIRYTIQFIWGTELRQLDVNRTATVDFLGLSTGRIFFVTIAIGLAVLIATGLMLRYTTLGKRMRALADNIDLAETSGIDTSRVILLTWIFAGAFAGLAGVMAGATTQVQPELGFEFLLPIFAVVVMGGIGNAFGALTAGIVLGVVIEWSTLLVDARWKYAIGFVILVLVLMIRPQGIFGKAKAV